MALVCDLQSMLHMTLTHLTVITNKHHAQSFGLLFCLPAQVAGSSLCGPSREKAKKCPGLLSLTEDPLSGKGKRRAGKKLYSQPPPPQLCSQAQVLEGNIQQHRKDLFWEVGKRSTHSLGLHCPCLRPYSYNLTAKYLPNNFRVRKDRGVRRYWGRTQALQPSFHNLTHHSLRLLVPTSTPSREQ